MKKTKNKKKESFFEKEAAIQKAVEAADAEIEGKDEEKEEIEAKKEVKEEENEDVKDEKEADITVGDEAKDVELIEEMEEREEEEVSRGLHDTFVTGNSDTPKKRFYKSRLFQFGVLVILLILVTGLVFTFQKDWFASKLVPSTSDESAQEVGDLIAEVGEKMLLPENDPPTVATVSDISKLSNEPFFENAQNGDKVLIFATTKQAILYRPSIDKIIAVAPVDPAVFEQTTQAAQNPQASGSSSLVATPTEVQKLSVVVLNSTQTSGLARKAGDLLDEELYEVVSTSNAQGEYETTVISSAVRGQISDSELEKIASVFEDISPEVEVLPSDEAAPAGADVVIIVGTDFDEAY